MANNSEIVRKQYLTELTGTVLQKVKNMIILTDIESKVVWVNKAFEEHTGFTLGDIEGKVPKDLLHGPESSAQASEEMRQALAERRYFQTEIINYRKDGSQYWVQIDCSPLFTGDELTGFLAVQSDISQKKHEEMKIRQKNQFLKELLQDISHKLRAPITSVLGLYEILKFEKDEQQRAEIIELFFKTAGQLDEIIKDLNDKIYKESVNY